MRWFGLVILAEVGCVSARAPTSATTTPPDLTGYRLVGEWEKAVPVRDDIRPYRLRRPLVQVIGRQEVIIFDDGAVFAEAKNDSNEVGFLKKALSGADLAALREDLTRFGPTLLEGFLECSLGETVHVACHLGSADFSGLDCSPGPFEEGQQVGLASRVITRAVSTPPTHATAGSDWYSRVDLEGSLSPISYKRYLPPSASQTDVQPGVAPAGASPRR
jgi:hypothetical protein